MMAAERTYPVCSNCRTRRLDRLPGLGFLYCKRCDKLDTMPHGGPMDITDMGGEAPNG